MPTSPLHLYEDDVSVQLEFGAPAPARTPAPRPPSGPASWLERLADRLRGSDGGHDAPPDEAPGLAPEVLDAIPDAFLIVDAEDRVQAANQAVGALLGYDPEALVGTALAEVLLPPRFREAHRARLRRYAETRRGGALGPSAPLPVVRADGSELLAELSVRPAATDERVWFGVCIRDVQTAQAAEAALVAARDVAEARQRILRTIVDAVPDPILAIDREGHVVLRNRSSILAAARFSGGPAAGADTGLTPEQWHEADAVMNAGVPVIDREEPAPAGGVQLATRIPVLNQAGAVLGLVAISRDVTAQKAAEARLRDDKLAAEAAARANNDFLATTSHEIRTLMNGVTGMTNLLLSTDLDEEQSDFADTIRTSSDALLTIINDILDFSKIEAGMLALEAVPFNVERAVRDAVSMVAQQAAAKSLDLTCQADADVPVTVCGDATRVQQVLVNLLSNAVKFTDTGSIQVRVGLAPPMADGRPALAFAVEDTGVGIAPERLEAVFEQFTQADASTTRTHGGTGLGLAICRRLVHLMGGELSATSVPGGGSIFWFTVAVGDPADTPQAGLPPAAPAATAAPIPPAEEVWISRPAADLPADEPEAAEVLETAELLTAPDLPVGAAPGGPAIDIEVVPVGGAPVPDAAPPAEAPPQEPGVLLSTDAILPAARVLLAEDNPVNQKVTTLTLRRLGYLPDVVADGVEAVDAVRHTAYDVVLMDVMMPNMDGLEATRQIRADPGPHPAPAIVALTANAMQGDRQKCLDAGCDDYLAKPVAPRLLAATIERAIRAREGIPVEA